MVNLNMLLAGHGLTPWGRAVGASGVEGQPQLYGKFRTRLSDTRNETLK